MIAAEACPAFGARLASDSTTAHPAIAATRARDSRSYLVKWRVPLDPLGQVAIVRLVLDAENTGNAALPGAKMRRAFYVDGAVVDEAGFEDRSAGPPNEGARPRGPGSWRSAGADTRI